MPEIVDTIIFKGDDGMNTDMDPRLMPPGDSVLRRNFRTGTSRGTNMGNGQSITGNLNAMDLLINTAAGISIPANSQCIGAFAINNRNSILFFVANTVTASNHGIYEMDRETFRVIEVLSDADLNFSPDHPIHHVDILGDVVMWTDGYNAPRSINIVKAIAYTDGTTTPYGDVYHTIDEQLLSFIPYSPLSRPTVTFIDDDTIEHSNLADYIWQFAYRWVYDDGKRSVLSPFSDTPIPFNEIPQVGVLRDLPLSNKVSVRMEPGSDEVIAVEVLVRNQKYGNWTQIDRVARYNDDGTQVSGMHTTTFTKYYYGNELLIAIDQDEANELQHNVPLLAGAQLLTSENIMVYGDITTDYDPVTIEGTMAVSQDAVAAEDFIVLADMTLPAGVPTSTFDSSDTPPEGSILFALWATAGTKYPANFDSLNHVVTAAEYAAAADIGALFANVFGATRVSANVVEATPLLFQGFFGYIPPSDVVVSTFKDGATHNFGLLYYDAAGRQWPVMTAPWASVYVETIPEIHSGATFTDPTVNTMDWTISHDPPDDAVAYQWVWGGSNIWSSKRFDVNINSGSYEDEFLVEDEFGDENASISDRVNFGWTFMPGDKIRILATVDNTGQDSGDFTQVYTALSNISRIVKRVDEVTGNPFVASIGSLGAILLTSTSRVTIEVYRERAVTDEPVYFACSPVYTITAGVHDTLSGNISGGDQYIRVRTQVDPYAISGTNPALYFTFTEDEHYSDYFESRNPMGRYAIEVPGAKQQRYKASMISGGKVFPGSLINDLHRFQTGERLDLPIFNGAITVIRQLGYTMKVLQESTITSVYVSRNMFYDEKGKEQLVRASSLFGTKIESTNGWGTKHPGSVSINGRHVYYYDGVSGSVIRDAANGQEAVSKNFMSEHFRELRDRIAGRDGGRIKCRSCYNPDTDEYILLVENFLFTDDDPLPVGGVLNDTEVVVFHESSNRWKYLFDFYPEWIFADNGVHIGFVDGEPWVTGLPGSVDNTFFGTAYKSYIDIIANAEPTKEKVYRAISITGSGDVEAPTQGDVEVYGPNNDTGSGYKQSAIPFVWFNRFEGKAWAPFLKDMNTKNAKAAVWNLVNGDELRGEALRVRLHSRTAGTPIRLSLVQVTSINSEKS